MAIETTSQNSGGGCFPTASRTTEQVSVVDPICSKSLHQRLGNLGLADQLTKGLRSISTIKSGHHDLSLPLHPGQAGREVNSTE